MDAVFSKPSTVSASDCLLVCRRSGQSDQLQSGANAGSSAFTGCLHRPVPGRWRSPPRRCRAWHSGRLPRRRPACMAAAEILPLVQDRMLSFHRMACSADPSMGLGKDARRGLSRAVPAQRSADNTYYVKLPIGLPQGCLLHPFDRNRFKSMS